MAVDPTPHPLVSKLAQSLLRDPESRGVIVNEVKEKLAADAADAKAAAKAADDAGDAAAKAAAEVDAAAAEPADLDAKIEKFVCRCLDAGTWPITTTREPVLRCLIEQSTKILTSPNAPLDFVTLTGYLGPGDDKDRMRLYVGPDLGDYISLRKDDILLRHPFNTQHAPFDSVDVVWLKRNVVVGRDRRHVRRDPVAEFLEGELMDAADLASELPTSISGSTSDEPFCVSYTCCKRTSRCRPGGGG